MNKYIKRLKEICEKAKPGSKMMFDNFGNYVLYIEKNTDDYKIVDIEIYEKDAIIREGRYKDVLVGERIGIQVKDINKVIKKIIGKPVIL